MTSIINEIPIKTPCMKWINHKPGMAFVPYKPNKQKSCEVQTMKT